LALYILSYRQGAAKAPSEAITSEDDNLNLCRNGIKPTVFIVALSIKLKANFKWEMSV
jgi:hypothetical protein